jgi:c-di-GMP-binding flagellar brake protein YcgR
MTNRRKHIRVPIFGTATLKFEDRNTIQTMQTLPANISLGGIGLYSNNSIEMGTDVLITINFVSLYGEARTASIEGHVIYNNKIGDTSFLGIRFNEEINFKNEPSLYEHAENLYSGK